MGFPFLDSQGVVAVSLAWRTGFVLGVPSGVPGEVTSCSALVSFHLLSYPPTSPSIHPLLKESLYKETKEQTLQELSSSLNKRGFIRNRSLNLFSLYSARLMRNTWIQKQFSSCGKIILGWQPISTFYKSNLTWEFEGSNGAKTVHKHIFQQVASLVNWKANLLLNEQDQPFFKYLVTFSPPNSDLLFLQ